MNTENNPQASSLNTLPPVLIVQGGNDTSNVSDDQNKNVTPQHSRIGTQSINIGSGFLNNESRVTIAAETGLRNRRCGQLCKRPFNSREKCEMVMIVVCLAVVYVVISAVLTLALTDQN